MRRIRTLVGLTALIATLSATSAYATTPPVHFTRVNFDSGSSLLSNYYLNKEYVVIKNSSTRSRSLYQWRLVDKRTATTSVVYHFPSFTLKPGAIVRVHTGKGTRTSTDLYWGLSHYVWDNKGDTTYLYRSSGTLDDTCSWTSTTTSPAYC